jgi:putative ABC transport system ATP-binding protein
MTRDTGAAIALNNVTKTYGTGEKTVNAVQDVSFSANLGEFIAIVGPSGSGKTTLLAMIGGLLTPTSGSVLINGENIAEFSQSRLTDYRRTRIGFVLQANNVIPYLTARENLLLMRAITGDSGKGAVARADQLLSELGLTRRSEALATELSGGERQRVAIARALMNEPLLVLVDEPTASLDSKRGKQVVDSLIAEVKDRGKLGIMVTHDMDMAKLADRILELHDGRITAVHETQSERASA